MAFLKKFCIFGAILYSRGSPSEPAIFFPLNAGVYRGGGICPYYIIDESAEGAGFGAVRICFGALRICFGKANP